jgi:hypothetical protein
MWRVVDGPPEWIDTTVEFLPHCSTKWAQYQLSLKQLVETGAGTPSPGDLQLSDWH